MNAPKQENGEFGTSLIERLIDVRLKARFQDESLPAAEVPHPDDDVISAFFEGRLDEAESLSIVSPGKLRYLPSSDWEPNSLRGECK